MAGVSRILYNTLFKRTSTFVVTIMAGAFVFQRGFDVGCHALFDSINEGKQWKDIKHKYEQ